MSQLVVTPSMIGYDIGFIVKAEDFFTDTADTELASHTPDTGTGWSIFSNSNRAIIGFTGRTANRVTTHKSESDGVHMRENTNIGDDDMEVKLTLKTSPITENMHAGPCGRYPSGSQYDRDQYCGFASKIESVLSFKLEKVVAATTTNLGTHADDPVADDVMTLKIVAATKKLFVNGVQKLSSSDDNLTGNQFAGIRVQGDANRLHEVDNYQSGVQPS